ncbi:xanthine dehydrogenase accessory protein XdhC [Microbacterium sp. AK031]|uniref:xanthine dehydrogenase accessory protein XdhC n=1 Tax=Microbacterium sp. AK031 TaxID=2723076 RepID=UPI002168D377|nr:xanthine dehydrogenase accessory protein XdhC [Microbacterium sp. AK031]MCS3844419.1 xanthine dehydrogenase accessory factor [Microbacterium sp. AK031]
MDWLDALQDLRTRRVPAVVVTMALVRGHAPRNGGAKMVVSPDGVFGTIGGGNLEATTIDRARAMLASGSTEPELLTLTLSDKATTEYGVQCCGGEVTMMLEPMRVVPVVAIFGIGHVGLELARVLARHEIDLHLIDSRPEMLALARVGEPGRDGVFADAVARIHITHSPVPEAALMTLPTDAHVLVMTHDHVEDLAVVDQSLRTGGIRSIGLIGSASKWARFRKKLTELGHAEADLARVTTPIGVPEVSGKQPAVIAVSVAARILQLIDEAAPVVVESAKHADDEPDADDPDAVNHTGDVDRAHR